MTKDLPIELQQVSNIMGKTGSQYWDHFNNCDACWRDFFMKEDSDCPEGKRLHAVWHKWKRVCKKTAKRLGIQLTVAGV